MTIDNFILDVFLASLVYVLIFTFNVVSLKRKGEKLKLTKERIVSELMVTAMFGLVFGGLAFVFSNITQLN